MPDELYLRVTTIEKRFGFRGKGPIVRKAVELLADAALNGLNSPDQTGEHTDYIAEMFELYFNYEPQPDGTVPVRKHNKRLSDYGEG